VPELPEVETVARDLARHLLGVTIAGARGDWPRAIASHPSLEAFAAAVAGRRVEAVGRRAKLVVVRLAGDAALTIHLKMTGQLFVVPAGTPADRHVHVVLELAEGRELRFRDIRKFGRVGCWPIDPATGKIVDGDIKEQTEQVMKNIGAILKEAGYSFKDVVKSTCLLSDMNNFAAMNEVYGSFYPENPPARAAYAVVKLPLGVLVEVETIAAK